MRMADWRQLWQKMLLDTRRIEFCNYSYWDKQACTVNENMKQLEDLTIKQLDKLPNLAECTVLDVGAGTGRLAIQLAKRAKRVTALEPSPNMMAFLKANAQRERVNNIEFINKSIEELDALSIAPHDFVIASFSLFTIDIEKALIKMDSITSKEVYIFLSASKWMDDEIRKMFCDKGNSTSNLPDFLYVYNILQDIGILAKVNIWDFQSKQSYNDLETATTRFMQVYHIPVEKQDELKVYLGEILTEDSEGKRWLNRKREAATIWWNKN